MAVLEADAILKELHALWTSLGRQADAGQSQGVVRACAMTLTVVAGGSEDPVAIGQMLAQVMREHPCRAILVRVAEEPHTALEARVTAQCWMPFGQREQICCEQIEIAAGAEDLAGIAPVLVALRAPDLPAVLWCRSQRIFERPEFGELWAGTHKLIIDSMRWDGAERLLARLADTTAPVADLAWTRITCWREIVADVLGDETARPLLPAIVGLDVWHGGDTPSTPARYLAAWVAGALGREIRVRFEAVAGAEPGVVEGFEVLMPEQTVRARRVRDEYVEIRVGASHSCTSCPRLEEPALLREELGILGRDPVYDNALVTVARTTAPRR